MNKIQLDQTFLGLEQYNLKDNFADQLTVFCYSFILWVSLFYVVNTNVSVKGVTKRNQDDIKNRIVAIVHGLFTFFLSGYSLVIEQPGLDSPNTNFQHFVFIFSGAYFLYDFIACFYYRIATFGISLHHILVTSAYLSSMNAQYGGTESMYALFFGEMSNWPMNTKDCLRAMNLKYTKIHELLENFFVAIFIINSFLNLLIVVYIIARGLFVPGAVVHCVKSQTIPLLLKIACVGLFLLSVVYIYVQIDLQNFKQSYKYHFFIFRIIKGIKRRGKYSKERKQKNINYFWFNENPLVKELSYYRASNEVEN